VWSAASGQRRTLATINGTFADTLSQSCWYLVWPNGSLVQQLGIHQSQQTIEGHNEAGVNIYAKNLPEQFLRLPEEESDLFGPHLDLMTPADGDRRGTVSSVKSASWVYRERCKMLEISLR